MRAAVFHGRQDIRVEVVPEPRAPAPGHVVLEVLRAGICGTDSSEWQHGPLQAQPQVVLGHEFVGRVVAVGDGVDDIATGERVVSGAGVSCGACEWCAAGRTNLCARYETLGLQVDGGLAELVATPAAICRRVPAAVGDDAAAMAQPLAVALHAVRRSGIGAGQTCVVVGAGGIGAFIVAAAASRPVERLVAVDIDEGRLETAGRLGAHVTIDARGRTLEEAILEGTDGEGAHVVIESSGVAYAPQAALTAVRRGGRVLLVGLQAAPREIDLFALAIREVELVPTVAHVCAVDLPEALDLLATTELADAVLDRVIPLELLVDDGLRALAGGTARGKIVVDPRSA